MTRSAVLDRVILADRIRVDAVRTPVQAIGVRNGRVAVVGTRADAAAWESVAPAVDYGDATVIPGLIDAHSHAVSAGVARRGTDLSRCISLDEVAEAVLGQPHEPDTDWLLGWSLDPNLFTGTTVGNAFLDGRTDRPVYLKMADGHSGIANRAALDRGGVTGQETFGSHAVVATDADGAPTGLLLEDDAMHLVRRCIPPLSPADQARSLRDVLQGMAGTGLTTLSLLDLEESTLPILRALEEDGDLPVRLRCSPVFDPALPFAEELDRVIGLQWVAGRRWCIEGVKFVLDGTIDNGTAWLEEPDTCGHSTHSLWHDPEQYRVALRRLAALGIPTATHAIGDRAIRHAVEGIAALTDAEKARAPHRIEHIETMPDELVRSFVASGAIASMQPTHSTLYVWPDHQDEWSRRLGPTRGQLNGFRFRDLVDAGVTVALGSDWPVAPYDPRGVIADAQLRRPHDRPGHGLTFPRQALAPAHTVDGYTRAAAHAIGWADRVGTLDIGRNADMTVFAVDPLTAPAETVATAPVITTLLDGEAVSA